MPCPRSRACVSSERRPTPNATMAVDCEDDHRDGGDHGDHGTPHDELLLLVLSHSPAPPPPATGPLRSRGRDEGPLECPSTARSRTNGAHAPHCGVPAASGTSRTPQSRPARPARGVSGQRVRRGPPAEQDAGHRVAGVEQLVERAVQLGGGHAQRAPARPDRRPAGPPPPGRRPGAAAPSGTTRSRRRCARPRRPGRTRRRPARRGRARRAAGGCPRRAAPSPPPGRPGRGAAPAPAPARRRGWW